MYLEKCRMKTYRQTSKKISYSSDKEFQQEINALSASGDMAMTIKPTIPEATDTKQWSLVNYWVHEQN